MIKYAQNSENVLIFEKNAKTRQAVFRVNCLIYLLVIIKIKLDFYNPEK
jgi:hypothetical protein